MKVYHIDAEALRKAFKASARWQHFSMSALGRMLGYADGTLGKAIDRGQMTEQMIEKVSKRFNIECSVFVRDEVRPEYHPKKDAKTLALDVGALNGLLPENETRNAIALKCGFDTTTLNKALRTGFASSTFIAKLCEVYGLNADDFVIKEDAGGKVPTVMPAMLDLDALYDVIHSAMLAALKEVFTDGANEN